MILFGKPIADQKKLQIKNIFEQDKFQNKFLSILLFSDDKASNVYVNLKQKCGQEVGLETRIIRNNSAFLQEVLTTIHALNIDPDCVGMLVQLPLPEHLTAHKATILKAIHPYKDVDGLSGILLGTTTIQATDFIPATAKAVFELLKAYNFTEFKGKIVTIIGQGTVSGKPLAIEMINREAIVHSFNHLADSQQIKEICKTSDFIFSATGVAHLIDETFIRKDGSQVIVDIGYAMKDGKNVGDVNFDAVQSYVKAISPVPGGVGPLTVISIFENIIQLQNFAEEKVLPNW